MGHKQRGSKWDDVCPHLHWYSSWGGMKSWTDQQRSRKPEVFTVQLENKHEIQYNQYISRIAFQWWIVCGWGERKAKIKWQHRGWREGKKNLRGTKFEHHFTRTVDPVSCALKLLCKCYSVNSIWGCMISKQDTVISGRVQCGEWMAGTLAWMWLSIMVACLDPVDCTRLSFGS